MRVGYYLLSQGEIPVFSRPTRGLLRMWKERVSLPAWRRLMLDDEGLADTTWMGGGWQEIPSANWAAFDAVMSRFVVELHDVNVLEFASFVEKAVAKLPSKRGNLMVILRQGSVTMKGQEPEFFIFGLLQDPHGESGSTGPPPARIAHVCPVSV